MKKAFLLLLISIFLALAASTLWPNHSFEEQLIRIQVKSELGDEIKTIEDESIEIQSVLLDYSADRELVLKVQLAMMKYPEQTRELLLLFGSESDFQMILLKYGEVVIPVIDYSLASDLKLTTKFKNVTNKAKNKYENWRNGEEDERESSKQLGHLDEAWDVIQDIKKHGYDYLGQFTIDERGGVKRNTTEFVTEGLAAFFTGGVRELETRYDTDKEITGYDLLWAGVDVLAVAGTLKLLRVGKQPTHTGKSVGQARTAKLSALRLAKVGVTGRTIKFSAIAATVWVIIKHPSLIVSLLAEVGKQFGFLAQVIGISLLVFVLLYPFSWLMKLFIRPLITVVKWVLMILTHFEKRFRSHVSTGSS